MNFYRKRLYGIDLKCPICGGPMEHDDTDFRFDGFQDEYYICEKCSVGAFVKVRYGKVCKTEFTDEQGRI